MRVLVSILGERISPVLDVARHFVAVDVKKSREIGRHRIRIEYANPADRVKAMTALNADVLICGAVSRSLEMMLVSKGIQLILNTCGSVDTVLAAFISGDLKEETFLLPGCIGRQYRFQRQRGHKRKRGGRR